jgi:hypothetical protein
MAFLSGFELVVFILTLGFVLAISVPLTGTLVRFRASYNQRGLALDAEGGAQPFTGPVVNSYFGMMARVYRIEVTDPNVLAGTSQANAIMVRVGLVSTKASVSVSSWTAEDSTYSYYYQCPTRCSS